MKFLLASAAESQSGSSKEEKHDVPSTTNKTLETQMTGFDEDNSSANKYLLVSVHFEKQCHSRCDS